MKKSILSVLCIATGIMMLVSCKTKQGDMSNNFTPSMLQGDWDIDLPGVLLRTGQCPLFSYKADDNRVSVKTGCNILGGSPVFENKGVVSFGNLMSTMMMCPEPDMQIERSILNALNAAKTIRSTPTGFELLDDKKSAVLFLNKINPDLLNGEWTVTAINGQEIPNGTEAPNIQFDLKQKRIYGFTGCNRMNGPLEVSDNSRKISFGNIGTTRMACMGANVEAEFLKTLSEVSYFRVNSETLDLLNNGNQTIISLVKGLKK